MQRLGSDGAAGQGVTAGEFDRLGNVAERNEPVSFTRHRLFLYRTRFFGHTFTLRGMT